MWWRAPGKKQEYAILKDLLEDLMGLRWHQNSPTAFLVNACLAFHAIAPPGSGTQQEHKDKGDYALNMAACRDVYLPLYKENKDLPEAELDRKMCRAWADHSDNHKRGGNHNKVDWSYFNSALKKNACKSEYKQHHN